MTYPIPIPAWFWTWARWYLGRSEFKGHAREKALRPKDAPTRIPAWAWAELLRRFVTSAPVKPPLPPLEDLGRNVIFTAWNPEAALAAPSRWKVAVSADPAYETAVRVAVPKLQRAGHLVAVWGCQTQTGVDRIRDFGKSIGADYEIMQAETVFEFKTAVDAKAKLVVGNPNAWTDSQRAEATALANRGDLGVMFEVYTNAGDPWPDAASSRDVPIVSEVLGVGWGSGLQLRDYKPRTPAGVWATMGVYLAESMSPESWALLA